MLIMVMGCIGLTLNVISVIFLHGMSCWHFATELSKADCSEHDDHEVAHGNLDDLVAENGSESYMLQEVSKNSFDTQE